MTIICKRHINEFIRLRCAGDILNAKLFPNAKEITESMGAFHAVRSVLMNDDLRPDRECVALVSVGDGCTPRTAGLFAFRTAWGCWSIDPRLHPQSYSIKRLHIEPVMIEDVVLDFTVKGEFIVAVIVLVHSHAPMDAVLNNIKAAKRHVVAIPCCVPQEIHNRRYIGYQDINIWSPQNTVKIWKDV